MKLSKKKIGKNDLKLNERQRKKLKISVNRTNVYPEFLQASPNVRCFLSNLTSVLSIDSTAKEEQDISQNDNATCVVSEVLPCC